MEEKEILAKNLIRLRKNAGLSQVELAKKLNYSNKNISKWENGETMPNAFVLQKIANIYGVTMEELVSDNPHDTPQTPEQEVKNKSKRKLIFRITMLLLANAIMYALGTVLIYILKLVGVTNFNLYLIYLYLSPLTCLSVTIFVRVLYQIVDFVSLTFFGVLGCLSFYISFINTPHIVFVFVIGAVYEIIQVCIALLVNIKLRNDKSIKPLKKIFKKEKENDENNSTEEV